MKKFVFILLFLILFAGGALCKVTQDITDIGVGARPMGMGKAFVGLADDASAVFLNPAGFANINAIKFMSMYTKLISEVQYISVASVLPTSIGKFGVGLIGTRLDDSFITQINPITGRIEAAGGSINASDSVYFLSYAAKLKNYLDYGLSLKIFNSRLTNIAGGSATGWDLDAGMLYKPKDWIGLGILLQNMLPSSVGGTLVWGNGTSERIPAVVKIGGSLKYYDSRFVVLFDKDIHISRRELPSINHIGLEWKPLNFLKLRTGIDQQASADQNGVSVYNNFTAGASLIVDTFSFDYAYHTYGNLPENNTHYVSFSYFGRERDKTKETKAATKESMLITPEVVATTPEAKVVLFTDVMADDFAAKEINRLADLAIVTGYPDKTFRSSSNMNRAEFCAILSRAAKLMVKDSDEKTFPDVDKLFWAAQYIEDVTNNKIITRKFGSDRFGPDIMVLREDAVGAIFKIDKFKVDPKYQVPSFPDIKPDFWAAKYISTLEKAGMFDYLKGHDFEPQKKITRGEVAYMLARTKLVKKLNSSSGK